MSPFSSSVPKKADSYSKVFLDTHTHLTTSNPSNGDDCCSQVTPTSCDLADLTFSFLYWMFLCSQEQIMMGEVVRGCRREERRGQNRPG